MANKKQRFEIFKRDLFKCEGREVLRYFCGICWNKIRASQEDALNAE